VRTPAPDYRDRARLEIPLSPIHARRLEKYGGLPRSERVTTQVPLLYEDGLGEAVSAMHNPVGRIRPDLGTSKRICTLESTGMPAHVSASRMAAALTDFEFTHALIENYFRKHGCDLGPMVEDRTLWAILGPLDTATFVELQDRSDRECTDIVLTTAAGTRMTLTEFYEMKRIYMHKHLMDVVDIMPRDIDDVYYSLGRMLAPPSGQEAKTVEQYITDPKLRSTGNWGRILRNAFVRRGARRTQPDAVLRVVNRITMPHARYYR
jgi:hypothetical protein